MGQGPRLGFAAVAAATSLAVAGYGSAQEAEGRPPPSFRAGLRGEAPGQVIVIQGDLLLIRGQAVRLSDVAVPTPAQRCDTGHGFAACGVIAMQSLRELIGAGFVQCRVTGLEATPWAQPKPVWVGVCQARGADLGEAIVVAGYADAAPASAYSKDAVSACVARREGQDVRPVFIGARSGTPCLRAMEAPRRR